MRSVLAFTFSVWFCQLAQANSNHLPKPYEPFQLVRPNHSHTGFEVVTESISQLIGSSEEVNIAVVSVVGPYHSGKSFLLNALIGKTNVFSVGPKTTPETMGLWMCRTDIVLPGDSKAEVWFVDSEGFFGPKVPESYDAKVFTLAMLLGDEFVYNTVKIIDAQAVSMLEMLARRAQLFRTKSVATTNPPSGETTQMDHSIPTALSKLETLPHLTWVVEDFVQLKDGNQSKAGDVTPTSSPIQRWLESYLDHSDGNIPYLRRIFPDLLVQSLFLPATSREQLSDLSKVPFEQLTEDFRSDLFELKSGIFDRLVERLSFRDAPAHTTKQFAQLLYFFAKALEQGSFPELPSLWHSWQDTVAHTSVEDAFNFFSNLMQERVDHGDDRHVPLGKAGMYEISTSAFKSSVTLFNELVRDFAAGINISGIFSQLTARLVERYKQSAAKWTEDVRKHIQERMKIEFSQFLNQTNNFVAKQRLFDPQVVLTNVSSIASKVMEQFSLTVLEYEGGDSGMGDDDVDLASSAINIKTEKLSFPEYPKFTVNPVSELRSEIQSQLDSLLSKNLHLVHEQIKAVATVAGGSVTDELISKGAVSMYGRKSLELFKQTIINATSSYYEQELGKVGDWMINISPQYTDGQAKVGSEVSVKLGKFAAANFARLSDWMNKQSEKALNVYRDQKNVIATSLLPCDETALELAHGKAVEALIHSLDTELGAKQYVDSEAYETTRYRLNSIVESELDKLRKKNIELWKVHSDTATHCAMEANVWYTAENCPQGWFCLFKIWPGSHRKQSLEHLLHCFEAADNEKKSTGAPESIRMQIFESWYSKELAAEVAEVRSNMWISMISLLAPVLWIGYVKYCMWQTSKSTLPISVTSEADYVHDVSYNYYGNRLAVCTSSQAIHIWDSTSDSNEWSESSVISNAHAGPIWRLDWVHPSFGQIIASCSEDRTICIWAESGGKEKVWKKKATLTDSPYAVTDVQFGPRNFGLKLAACTGDGIVRVYEAVDPLNLSAWEVEDFNTGSNDSIGGGCTALSWCGSSTSTERIAVTTMGGKLKIFERHNKWIMVAEGSGDSRNVSGSLKDCAWAPNLCRDNDWIAACGDGQYVYVWEFVTAKNGLNLIHSIDCSVAPIWRCAWSVTGDILSVAPESGNVQLWRLGGVGSKTGWEQLDMVR